MLQTTKNLDEEQQADHVNLFVEDTPQLAYDQE